mgnify:CR=1 FL=1
MNVAELAPEYIRAISPYIPGKPITELAREMGLPVASIVKLASNENPLGMSPKARQAVERALAGVERYPDQFDLVSVLAERHGVTPEQIILGNGSNDVLDLAARVFLAPGRSAVCSAHAFAVYPLATRTVGADILVVPARNFGHDLDAMAAAVRPDTRMIWIANPNNPTGNFLPYPQLDVFLDRLPKDVMVVLDEAYNEFLPPADRVDTVGWVRRYANLLVVRTFSKIYGLAGLRIGYGVAAPAVADLLNRIRQPFNVNNLALVAAAAALEDHQFIAESYELNRRGMEQLLAGFKRLNLAHIPSHGNFITFAVPEGETGASLNQKLLRQGVIVRPIAGYGLPNHLRVTIGLETENVRFLEALEAALRQP